MPISEDSGQSLEELYRAGHSHIEMLAKTHSGWGCGNADRWDVDQETGLIEWAFPDRIAIAPAQILASYSRPKGTWMWGWANKSILPSMRRDSEQIRDWALGNGHAELAEPVIEADENRASDLSALAVLVTQAKGFYNPVDSELVPIMTFGDVSIAPRS